MPPSPPLSSVVVLLLASALVSSLWGAPDEGDAAIVRRVADKILLETKWTVTDKATGTTHVESRELPPAPTVKISSRFNEWYYPTLMVMEGMSRLNQSLHEPAYGEFSGKTLDFVARHADWFRRAWEAEGKKPDGIGRLGHYLKFNVLWTSGLAPLWIERSFTSKDAVYQDYTGRFTKIVDTCARNENRVLLAGLNIRTDDVYLMAPGILRLGLGQQNPARVDDAVQQVVASHRILFRPEQQLYYQSWDVKAKKFTGDFWGRGNGWMAMAHVDLLGHLPENHPRRAEALAAYREQMAGLRRWQAPEGGWGQLMDVPEAWVETSCTGMFTYALARGVNEGWLDASYAADARRGWKALCSKVRPNGVLFDVSPATSQGDRASYLNRPRAVDDPHGYGPFLLAGAEILRLGNKNSPRP